jgi:hypothetical protein
MREIQNIIEFSGERLKTALLVLTSTGIRVGFPTNLNS